MTPPLNICLVSQEYPPYTNWGGVGVQFENLATSLAARGDRVVVISRASSGAPRYEKLPSGVEVWRVGKGLRRKLLVGRTIDRMLHARAVARLARRLDRERPFDAIEAPEAGLEGELLVRDSRFTGRMVICCHGSNIRGQAVGGLMAPLHRLDWAWSFRREQDLLRRARCLIAASDATRDTLLGQGVEPGKIELIPLGIDTARFRPPVPPRGGPVEVGFVGRLQAGKGIDFVWRVLERMRDDRGIRFHLKGAIHPANARETTEQLRRFSGVVSYHPPGDSAEMPDFYRSLDVLLLPSRFENFGLTYVEAMATELLVFAGNRGGGPEVVTDGVTGFLVDPDGAVDAVVERLRTMAGDRSAYSEIRRAARRAVVEKYSVEQFAARKAAIYEDVRRRSRGGGPA